MGGWPVACGATNRRRRRSITRWRWMLPPTNGWTNERKRGAKTCERICRRFIRVSSLTPERWHSVCSLLWNTAWRLSVVIWKVSEVKRSCSDFILLIECSVFAFKNCVFLRCILLYVKWLTWHWMNQCLTQLEQAWSCVKTKMVSSPSSHAFGMCLGLLFNQPIHQPIYQFIQVTFWATLLLEKIPEANEISKFISCNEKLKVLFADFPLQFDKLILHALHITFYCHIDMTLPTVMGCSIARAAVQSVTPTWKF